MPTQSKLLLIRPVINAYSYPRAFFEALSFSLGLVVKQKAFEKNWRVIDLPAERATKADVQKALASYSDVSLVIFLGHGNAEGTVAMGQGKVPVVDQSNLGLISKNDRGLYFLCCHAASLLGKEAVDGSNRNRFFMGLLDKFYLCSSEAEHVVSQCALYGVSKLLEGLDPRAAWAQTQGIHAYWISQLETRREALDPDWIIAVAVLKSNMENFVLLEQ